MIDGLKHRFPLSQSLLIPLALEGRFERLGDLREDILQPVHQVSSPQFRNSRQDDG